MHTTSDAPYKVTSAKLQAEWLPEEYRTGGAFRAATRFKGAGPVLQQQLADGSGLASQQYTPRRVGVGSTAGHMQWQVSQTLSMAQQNPVQSSMLFIHASQNVECYSM